VIPTEGEAIALHRKHGSNGRTVEHCKTVASVARLLAEELRRHGRDVDLDAVVAGALLHDIGRTRTQTVKHGLEGASLIEREGADAKVVEIVRRHVGAGISAEEASQLGLPELDFVPRTLEQRIVCFADKMVDHDRIRPFGEEVRRFEAKGHDVARLLALKSQLQEDLGGDPEKFVLDKIKESH
jgi:uncharacterized protein